MLAVIQGPTLPHKVTWTQAIQATVVDFRKSSFSWTRTWSGKKGGAFNSQASAVCGCGIRGECCHSFVRLDGFVPRALFVGQGQQLGHARCTAKQG